MAVPREAQGFALDDQVVADPDRLISQPVARLGLRTEQIRGGTRAPASWRLVPERVQTAVQARDLVEDVLEPLPGSAQRLRLRPANLLLHAREAILSAARPVIRGPGKIVLVSAPRRLSPHPPVRGEQPPRQGGGRER